ncbi:MAG: Flp pilus assembly protein CpaB [Chloroflexi bacterium]|nr:Flp pilus assembly protein CpaB [Chloroflexota bacterium]
MTRAGRILFLLGILISLGAGFVIYMSLSYNQPKPVEVPTTKLVVAFQEISPRSEIGPGYVGVADWPRALPTPVGAFTEPDQVVGKLATASLSPGQPITAKMVVDKKDLQETHSNAALILEKGMVAIAMPISIKSDVADAVQPGDRVDIIATFRSQNTNNQGGVATQRVLGDVLILQVGPWPSAGAKAQSGAAATVVTLQMKEQDALALQYTLDFASSVTLALRPANDHDLIQLEPVTLDYINQRFNFRLPK